MTTTTRTHDAPSLREVLYGAEPERAVDGIAAALAAHPFEELVGGALAHLSAPGRGAVLDHLARAVTSLLDVSVGTMLGAAWTTHTDLREAGRRTIDHPGTREVVAVATHEVSSVQEPYVEVQVDGVTVARVKERVTATFEIEGLHAVVVGGRLVEVRGGTATGAIRLWIEQAKIADHATSFELPGVLDLAPGLSLVDAPDA